ncbi:delta-type opioid receptor-like [Ptychodera flava]|uniref:delta-type opioid receptor-like n=1 Tax=Ptychodera flava TaxID=63121 RepID=UPI003969D991
MMSNLTTDTVTIVNQTVSQKSEQLSGTNGSTLTPAIPDLNVTPYSDAIWNQTSLFQNETSFGILGYEVPYLTTVCVVGFIGNFFVVAVYSQKRSRQHNSSLYILNLAAGDLLALSVVVFHITEFYRDTWPILWGTDHNCRAHRYFRYVGFNITVSTMVAIAIDRYFAICHPVKFRISFTLKRTVFIIIILWILSLAAASPTLLMFKTFYRSNDIGDTYSGKLAFACKFDMPDVPWFAHFKAFYYNLVLFYIPSIVTVILNIIIIMEVRKRMKNPVGRRNSHERSSNSKFDYAHWKVARTLMIVFIAYFLSYVLLSTYNLALAYPIQDYVDPMVNNVGLLLPFANSCMNPIIYSFFNPNFREECRNLLCRKRQRDKARKRIYSIKANSIGDNSAMKEMSSRNPIEITDE